MSKSNKIGGYFIKPSILSQLKTLNKDDSGRVFFLNASAGFTITLPTPEKGTRLEFIVKVAPTTGNYKISSGTALIVGQAYSTDSNTANDSNFTTTAVSSINLIANVSKIGDRISLISDGTKWYVKGFCSIYNAITFV